MLYKGDVKHFNVQKLYGFINCESLGEVFFHFNDGEFLVEGRDVPVFSGEKTQYLPTRSRSVRLKKPAPGDVLAFHIDERSKGPVAVPWGYQLQYDQLAKEIARRPQVRVLEVMNSTGENSGEPEVLWEGTYIPDLRRRYPKPGHGKSISGDPLLSYWSDPDGTFTIHRWFEMQTEEGWERITDPR